MFTFEEIIMKLKNNACSDWSPTRSACKPFLDDRSGLEISSSVRHAFLGETNNVSLQIIKMFSSLTLGIRNICIRAKWPIRPELIPVSVAQSD